MSAITPPGAVARSSTPTPFRFGHESSGPGGEWGVEWRLKRNCSMAPRQLLMFFAFLSVLSLGVASFFWWHGAFLVMPFAWAEVIALAVAVLAYARHAADQEHIALRADRLTVDHASGNRMEHAEFLPQWVRVEPEAGVDSLVELSGQGQHIAIGRFVRPELRPQLAKELRMALRCSQQRGSGPALADDGDLRDVT